MTPGLVRAIPPLAQPGTAAAMIAALSSQVGYREGRENDNFFGKWYGMNNAPWCAIVISWAASVSGCEKLIPRHAYTPAGAAWFKARGQWGTKPRVGAIAYFYNAGMGRIAHVELVVRVEAGGAFISCGGNTNNTGSREGNGVYLQRRAGTRGGGFGYPKYLPAGTATDHGAAAAKAAVKKAADVVDLAAARAAAKATKKFTGVVAAALAKEGLTADTLGYARWQRSLGYKGSDADGYPGPDSLGRLGAKHGFRVEH